MPNFSGMTIPLKGTGGQGGALPQLKDPGVYVSGQAQSERVADVGNIAFAGEKEQAQALKGLGQAGIRTTERLDDAYISYSKTKALEAQNEYDKQMQDFLYGKDGVFQKYRGEAASQIPQLVQNKSNQVRGDLVQGMGQDSLATRWFDVSFGKSDAAYMVKADQQFRKEYEQWKIQTFDGRVANLVAQAEQDYADIDKVAEHMKTAGSTLRERLAFNGTTGEMADARVRQNACTLLANVAQKAATNNDMAAFDRIAKYGQDHKIFDAATTEKLRTMRGSLFSQSGVYDYSQGNTEKAAGTMARYAQLPPRASGRSALAGPVVQEETSNKPWYVKRGTNGHIEIGSFSFLEPDSVGRLVRYLKEAGRPDLYDKMVAGIGEAGLKDPKNWGSDGKAYKAFQEVASDPQFAALEDKFMEDRIFKPWLNNFNDTPELKALISRNQGVQMFVFSTMVQHKYSVDHVKQAFDKSGPDADKFLTELQEIRKNAPNSTPERYKREVAIARSMSGQIPQGQGIFTPDPKVLLSYDQSIKTIDRKRRYDVTTDVNARLPDARVLAMGGDVTELQACADELRSIGLTGRAEALHLEAAKYRETDKIRTWAGGATIPQQNERLGEIQTALQSPEVKSNPVLLKQYQTDEKALKEVMTKRAAEFKADGALAADSTPYVKTLPADATWEQRTTARMQAQVDNGVAQRNIKPLTVAEAQDLAFNYEKASEPDKFLAGIEQRFGKNALQVMAQLSSLDNGIPKEVGLLLGTDPHSQNLLAKMLKPQAMSEGERVLTASQKTGLDDLVAEAVQPFVMSLSLSGRQADVGPLQRCVKALAIGYMNQDGQGDAADACTRAVQQVIGHRELPCGTFSIPRSWMKKAGVQESSGIELALTSRRMELKASDIKLQQLPPSVQKMVNSENSDRIVQSVLGTNGVWVNDVKDGVPGVTLTLNGIYVLDTKGQPIFMSFDDARVAAAKYEANNPKVSVAGTK